MESKIKPIDSQGMFEVIKSFPQQVQHACKLANDAPVFPFEPKNNTILIFGMGGSAIAGDLLKTYASQTDGMNHLNIVVNRNYRIPKSFDKDSSVIFSSYSGDTEETITAFNQAIKFYKNIIVITTGGKLSLLAKENNIPQISLPQGFQPRAALGYSFFALLFLLIKSNFFNDATKEEILLSSVRVVTNLELKSAEYSNFGNVNNYPMKIAKNLFGKIPVFYSSSDVLDTVNIRFRGQIQENAKNLTFGNFLPEMNHNEINGWCFPNDMLINFIVVFLKDIDDYPRTKIRFDAIKDLLENNNVETMTIQSDYESLLERMFDLIYLADWVSYYLAIQNKVDPTPIPFINELKKILSSKQNLPTYF